MAIKRYRPTSAGRRFMTVSAFEEITKTEPEKSLTTGMRKHGGRNNTGMVMVRHHGGGHRRRYRMIDFKREKYGVPAKVTAIEYDPNRNARIALLVYADADSIRPAHIVEFFGLLGGGLRDAGWDGSNRPTNQLAILPGTTHYDVYLSPALPAAVLSFLE